LTNKAPYKVDGDQGTEVFPAEYFTIKQARNEYAGKRIDEVTVRKDWYGARLSAPGYMDATDWSCFDTEEAARQYLAEKCSSDVPRKHRGHAIPSALASLGRFSR
jgi:hypothetical protein